MSNFLVTFVRTAYLEEHEFLTDDANLAILLTRLLDNYPDLHNEGKLTIVPTKMEYFDGRP